MNIEKKGILNKREYLGPFWPADVLPANDIPFCSIFTYFQYSLIYMIWHYKCQKRVKLANRRCYKYMSYYAAFVK